MIEIQNSELDNGRRKNQKAPTMQGSLTRWAVDLHHTRRNGQSGFQAVTPLWGFTHQSHRNNYYSVVQNKNNTLVSEGDVFSPLLSVMLPLENRYAHYIKPTKYVKVVIHSIIYSVSSLASKPPKLSLRRRIS